ncbi:MAG: TonB-dependent receptor [bacterium]
MLTSPLFGADISDYTILFGARGESSIGFTWDIRARSAENEVDYVLNGSINPSLGRLSPTSFGPGTLTQEENSINGDFVMASSSSPMNLGFGFEWREETYKIGAGDAASIEVGPTFAQFGVGSDGFQGSSLESAGSFDSASYALYVDVETDLTDQLSGAIAVRFEDYDEFGSTVNWKISGRYAFTDNFAVRATANTGFRAPTPGQVNTLNVTTTSDSSGNLIPNGTYPVDHPVSLTLGSKPLDPEESLSFTLGLVWSPTQRTSITLDYYDIEIDDRIALLSNTIDAATVADLVAAGFPNANLLQGSNANFFVNGYTSNITGIDFALTSAYELGRGSLGVDFRHSYNQHEVSDVESGSVGVDRVYDLENQVPEHNTVLSLNYNLGNFDGLLRINRFGDWSTTGGLFGPGDASDATDYGSVTLVGIEASYTFADHYTVTVGGDNIFDEYPDKEKNGVLDFLGVRHAITSPFGFNGAFWYLRASAAF